MKSRDNDLPLFSAATRPRVWTVAGDKAEKIIPAENPPPAPTAGLELFQGASTNDGYTRWKAEALAEREAQLEKQRASELPSAAGQQGYETWKAEIAEVRRAFEHRWGVPLGKQVRVRLRGEWKEREGLLRLADDDMPTKGLRLGDHTFAANEIESVVRLD